VTLCHHAVWLLCNRFLPVLRFLCTSAARDHWLNQRALPALSCFEGMWMEAYRSIWEWCVCASVVRHRSRYETHPNA